MTVSCSSCSLWLHNTILNDIYHAFFSSSKTYEAIRLQPVYGLLNPDRYHLYAHELVFLFSDNFTMATILQLTLCNVQLPWDCCNVPLAHKDAYFFCPHTCMRRLWAKFNTTQDIRKQYIVKNQWIVYKSSVQILEQTLI